MSTASKRCTVAWATPTAQFLWEVQLPPEADIGAALAAARAIAGAAAVPWDEAPVGVFGEPRSRADPCADGDRIELYRPLPRDPRERRRERVRRQRNQQ